MCACCKGHRKKQENLKPKIIITDTKTITSFLLHTPTILPVQL